MSAEDNLDDFYRENRARLDFKPASIGNGDNKVTISGVGGAPCRYAGLPCSCDNSLGLTTEEVLCPR